MDGKFKYLSEKNKTTKKRKIELNFSKNDFLLVLIFPSLVKLLTNDNFLEFVVEIVKLITNRSSYYFCNNRIFIFYEVNMDLDKLIEQKIKDSRMYGVTKPSIIKEMLGIPENINLKHLDKMIDDFYDTFYIKKSWAKSNLTKKEKRKEFLSIEKEKSERLTAIPLGEDSTKYRKIVSINQKWLKKSQKKLNKILMSILLDKKVRGVKQKSIVPYLHSAVKQRSYHTNAQVHVGDKYVFAIDLKDFYPSVTKYKLYLFFYKNFNLSPDIAMLYSVLSTCKSDDNSYRLGQGLSQSSTLAYLVNYSLFNYLYMISKDNDIQMSIYVDDVVFSSSEKISQSFINRLFGIIKGNDMLIKRQKVHNYKKESVKKITGVYINGNKTRVANNKHYEFHTQYKYLKKKIINVNSIEEYYKIYNLYLKFYGNFQHIKMVEGRVHDRYESFISEYDEYFPKGINKKQKNLNYQKGNIKNISDNQKLNKCYQKLLNKM